MCLELLASTEDQKYDSSLFVFLLLFFEKQLQQCCAEYKQMLEPTITEFVFHFLKWLYYDFLTYLL